MKAFTISSAVALLAALAQATPTPVEVNARAVASTTLTFNGAAGAEYQQTFPDNGVSEPITNPLSVSSIYDPGPGTCTCHGKDGSVTVVGPGQTVAVGTPQPQISCSCV